MKYTALRLKKPSIHKIQFNFQIDGSSRTRALYETVTRRGPKAFKNLVKALNESGNTQAAEILEPAFNGSHHISLPNRTTKFLTSATNYSANG